MHFGFRSLKLTACLAATLLCASAVRADAPDTSTPKAAAVAFAKAVEAGDMDAAKSLATGTDAEFALVKAMSDFANAAKRYDAAASKFGDDGKLPKEMVMNLSADMASAEEKIDGDRATLVMKSKPDDQFPPTLKKEGGSWKMDLSNLSKDPAAGAMVQMIPPMVKAFDAVVKNIESGKDKTGVEALTDLQTQLAAATTGAGAEAGK